MTLAHLANTDINFKSILFFYAGLQHRKMDSPHSTPTTSKVDGMLGRRTAKDSKGAGRKTAKDMLALALLTLPDRDKWPHVAWGKSMETSTAAHRIGSSKHKGRDEASPVESVPYTASSSSPIVIDSDEDSAHGTESSKGNFPR